MSKMISTAFDKTVKTDRIKQALAIKGRSVWGLSNSPHTITLNPELLMEPLTPIKNFEQHYHYLMHAFWTYVNMKTFIIPKRIDRQTHNNAIPFDEFCRRCSLW